ncbi:hypothetical protein HDV62DRAFT_366643 [Trichoderma sp. SZMC 28011]
MPPICWKDFQQIQATSSIGRCFALAANCQIAARPLKQTSLHWSSCHRNQKTHSAACWTFPSPVPFSKASSLALSSSRHHCSLDLGSFTGVSSRCHAL